MIRSPETAQPHRHAASHFAGNVPATAALRILLTHAGVRAPHTGAPFTEAMVFGIAGGIGIGVVSFYYEKEDFASFFIGGREHESKSSRSGFFRCATASRSRR